MRVFVFDPRYQAVFIIIILSYRVVQRFPHVWNALFVDPNSKFLECNRFIIVCIYLYQQNIWINMRLLLFVVQDYFPFEVYQQMSIPYLLALVQQF